MLGGPIKTKPIPNLTTEQIDRFWSKIDKSGGPDVCWEWQSLRDKDGYGRLKIRPYGIFGSNRVAYYLIYHQQPGNLCVLHTCDNPPCCNPKHLWLGTQLDNIIDRCEKDRTAHQFGEVHGLTTLREKDILEILYSSKTGRNLAEHFNVDPMTISNIQRGTTWKNFRLDIPRRQSKRTKICVK